jgi:acetylornithine deacetylase/succinyl-diaminopimelate desuccinylase-like protein
VTTALTTFDELWSSLAEIGRDPRGGYSRLPWTPPELACREWFAAQAAERGMASETDRNGNLWAWWGDPAAGGVVATGSHLDSVPSGGAYDGALGVACGFAAGDARSLWSRSATRRAHVLGPPASAPGSSRACSTRTTRDGSRTLTG